MSELARRDILKFIISSNVDGNHRESGVDAEKLAELQGNSKLEVCAVCKREHMRNYRVRSNRFDEQLSKRTCETPGCGGTLKETEIR